MRPWIVDALFFVVIVCLIAIVVVSIIVVSMESVCLKEALLV